MVRADLARMLISAFAAHGLAACRGDVSVIKQPVDHDNDGYDVEVDCDDANKEVNPSAPEVCNSIDDDCDGAVDDADDDVDLSTASAWYRDSDGDGFGDPDDATLACALPTGMADNSGDCDD
jgi:hypothetical protein